MYSSNTIRDIRSILENLWHFTQKRTPSLKAYQPWQQIVPYYFICMCCWLLRKKKNKRKSLQKHKNPAQCIYMEFFCAILNWFLKKSENHSAFTNWNHRLKMLRIIHNGNVNHRVPLLVVAVVVSFVIISKIAFHLHAQQNNYFNIDSIYISALFSSISDIAMYFGWFLLKNKE